MLKKNLTRVKKEHGAISVTFLKLFFTGSGDAGKTSFVKLLLKKKFDINYTSTKFVNTSHAVSVKRAVLHESASEVTWYEFDPEFEFGHLQSILLSKPSAALENPPPVTKVQSTNTKKNIFLSAIRKGFDMVFHANVPPASSDDFNLSTFDNIIDAKVPKPITHQPKEVLKIITLLDTGGQPQYIHLLPTINIYPTVTFVVHDLSKSLGDKVLVKYNQPGKQMFQPCKLNYSNLDMIKLLMSAANDSIERSISNIPKLVTIPGRNKKSYICLVGTHADMVSHQVVAKAESELGTLVNKTHCEAAVWQNDKGTVLFSVDNTTSGDEHIEDPMANIIRNKIDTLAKQKDIYELPITWVLLELEIQHVCSEKEKPYILFQDCVTLARESGLMTEEEEVKSVLLYYHLLGILIYFDEVSDLRDYVIMDHQWWFTKLSSIIQIAFKQVSDDHKAERKLKYQGLLSKDLLQHVGWEGDIKEELFLSLLIHMRIIAPTFSKCKEIMSSKQKEIKEYFIPFILPSCNFDQYPIHQYGHLQKKPLLIHFQSGLLPRGMFCSLIVELLQFAPKDWHPHFSHVENEEVRHTFSNLISFRLHDGYSLSLLDKVSYLEVQIRHVEKDISVPVHNGVYNYLVYALTDVCIHLNFDYERLQYGFECQCGKGIDNHIAVIPDPTPLMRCAECSIDSLYSLPLGHEHLVWFSSVQTSLNISKCS